MTSTTRIIRNAILAVVGAAVLLPNSPASDADASGRSRSGSSFVEKDFVVPLGTRGHTGSVAGAYCDYIRRPIRTCTYTRSGHESCRVTRWVLTQTCYR